MFISVRRIPSNDIYEPIAVLVPVSDTSASSLCRAIQKWSELLANAQRLIISDKIFENSDEWFGFGVELHGSAIGEQSVFEHAPNDQALEKAIVGFVEVLIAYNHTAEEALATHEEMDTGTYALRWLLLADLRHMPLYLRYLDSIDLDHSVSQLDVVFALAKKYTPAEVEPVIAYARQHGVQILNDWLNNERAWNKK